MIKLYGGARSRATIVQWYLEELQLPYEFVQLDMQAGENRQSEFLAINPFGKVPAIADEDFYLWESGAILLYLAQKYSNRNYSVAELARINQWIVFANATLASGIAEEANREREIPRLIPPLNRIFEQQAFVLGNEFSVVDVAIGSTLGYALILLKLDFSAYPAVLSYGKRISERPAWQKTMMVYSQ